VKPSATFTVARGSGPVPEFSLHEHCYYNYGRIAGVRDCLREHLAALRKRVDALQAILATQDPENAERLLFDQAEVAVTEVVLRPRSEFVAFEAMMDCAFQPEGRTEAG
jgi:hypothetical protein